MRKDSTRRKIFQKFGNKYTPGHISTYTSREVNLFLRKMKTKLFHSLNEIFGLMKRFFFMETPIASHLPVSFNRKKTKWSLLLVFSVLLKKKPTNLPKRKKNNLSSPFVSLTNL